MLQNLHIGASPIFKKLELQTILVHTFISEQAFYYFILMVDICKYFIHICPWVNTYIFKYLTYYPTQLINKISIH
jgi:hypothetical protein